VGKLLAELYSTAGPSAGPVIREAEAAATAAAAAAAADGGGGEAAAAGMPAFTMLTGTAAPLDIQNVDTDMIIPKEYLKTIKRTGLGFAAFAELRYDNPNEVAAMGAEVAIEKPDFVLNRPEYRESKILVAGDNFGCGSSREHAPWSIDGFGIRCIISTSFADIFYNNCFKNGMLPVVLPREQVLELLGDAEQTKPLTIDLAEQLVRRECGTSYPFDVDPFRKHCLLNGLDDIGLTMTKMDAIRAFEQQRSIDSPWLDGATTRVPKLFAIRDAVDHADTATFPELDTPDPAAWRAEVKARFAARQQQQHAAAQQ
jgi:3-isopropylmalate dehydratase